MKFHLFGHKIKGSSPHVDELIRFVNSTPGNLTIGMSSGGGHVGASLFILEMFNRNKDRIHLVAAGIIYSSAFDIFIGYKGYKSVLAGTMGMTHVVDTTVRVNEKGYYLDDDETVKNQSSYALLAEEIVYPIMNAKQKLAYDQGKDVYFTCDDLKRIATKHNRNNRVKKPS